MVRAHCFILLISVFAIHFFNLTTTITTPPTTPPSIGNNVKVETKFKRKYDVEIDEWKQKMHKKVKAKSASECAIHTVKEKVYFRAFKLIVQSSLAITA